jgi:heptose I phosphotransferase
LFDVFHFRWIDPDDRELVAQHRLDDLEYLLARRDGRTVAPGHRSRDTIRLETPAADTETGVREFYLKRERNIRWKHILRHAVSGRGFSTFGRVELEVLRTLRAAGLNCARPVACVQQIGLRSHGCLVLEAVPHVTPLNQWLAGPLRDEPRERREALFTLLGEQVARLHAAGVHHARLYADKAFVDHAAQGAKIWFLDFRRGRVQRGVSFAQRVEGAAALLATLPRRLADETDREAFLDAYLRTSELEYRGMEFAVAVEREVERLLTFRKIWEIRESDTAEHLAVRPLDNVEFGKMWIDRGFRGELESAGLDTFEAVMSTRQGRQLRALPDRENWRVELAASQAASSLPHAAYLKKHHVRKPATWLRAKIGAGPGESAGRIEAQNVARLSRSGIAAMKLIAYGEKLHGDGLLESFVLTEELVGYTQLDHFLERRFPPRNVRQPKRRNADLLALIREVAAVAAKFHKLGFNHRDLYCCHFFIKEPRPGEFKVNLIDLQRVEHRRRFRTRWIVKDLAQLAYSAPHDRISCTQRLAFIKHYLGVEKLEPRHRRLIRRVLAKQRWMENTIGVP